MYELVNFCEIDDAAAKAYCVVHNVDPTKNLHDVTQVDFNTLKNVTMLFGGSPCQDFSLAGKQAGVKFTCNQCGFAYNPMEYAVDIRNQCPQCESTDLTRTRSSLLQYFIEALLCTKPKLAIYENVSVLLSSKYAAVLKQFQYDLENAGYYYETVCLNCEDFNIPQHRKRVFIVFMHMSVATPVVQYLQKPKIEKTAVLKDYMDFSLAEHPHVSEFIASRFELTDATFTKRYCGSTLGADNTRFGARDKVCHERGAICTLTASDWKQPRAVLMNLEKYDGLKNGKVQVDSKDLWYVTAKEMFRLMGFTDEDYNKVCDTGITRTDLYRIAGNSITVNVLFYLFKAIYISNKSIFDDIHVLSLFSGVGAFEKALSLFLQCLEKCAYNVEEVEFPFGY